MVVFPFIVLVAFILENAFVFWIGAALDNGVETSMRQFYVRAESSAATQIDGVRTALCASMYPLVQCDSIRIDIAAYGSFAEVDPRGPVDDATQDWRAGFGTQHGCLGKGSIVVVQAAIAQQTFQNFGLVKSRFKNGSRLIASAAVIQLDGNASASAGC